MAENNANSQIGKVVVSSGGVFLETSHGLTPLSQGSPVFRNSVIVTKDTGHVEVKFADGTVLSQGINGRLTIDKYVFDQHSATPSSLLFNMGQGAFRVISGKIAEQNPENFNVKTPLATIGIRGTDFTIETGPHGEMILVGTISETHILVVEDSFGTVRFINYGGMLVVVDESSGIQEVRPASAEEIARIQALVPVTSFDYTQDNSDGHGDEVNGSEQNGDLTEHHEGNNGPHGDYSSLFGDGVYDPFHSANGIQEEWHSPFGDDNRFFDAFSLSNGGLYDPLEYREDWVNLTPGVVDQVLVGGDADDTLAGGDGNDWIVGGPGNDVLTGGVGNDLIIGGPGNDDLLGGAGNDVIEGNAGVDQLSGAAGNDIFVVRGYFAQNTYTGVDPAGQDLRAGNSVTDLATGERIDGGSGFDTLVTYGTTNYSAVALASLEAVVMHSDTTFSATQLNEAGTQILRGDGDAILRFAGNGTMDLSIIAMSGVDTLDLGPGVTLILSQENLRDVHHITGSGHLVMAPGLTALDFSGITIDSAIDTPGNDAPFQIAITNTDIQENISGAIVGTLSAADPDAGDNHTCAIISGGNDFEIVGDQLKLKAGVSLNFENPPTDLTMVIATTDHGGATFQQVVTVNLLDVNDAPSAITLAHQSVDENAPGAVVGNLSAFDQDSGDTLTFSIVSGGSDFEIVGDQLKLKAGIALDHEHPPADLDLVIAATDPHGATLEHNFAITVNDLNEAPTGISIDNLTIQENVAGAVVGTLTSTDQDVGDSHSYTIVSGGSDFEIVGDHLQLHPGVSLDFEHPPSDLSMVIESTDHAGATFQQTFTVDLLDVYDPPPNINPPVAVNDSVTTLASSPLGIDVLANDYDPDPGDVLTVTAFNSSGSSGNVALYGNIFVYDGSAPYFTLAFGSTAVDSFVYSIADSFGNSSTATVEVTVQGEAFYGTNGDDVLLGTAGNNYMEAMFGNDQVEGGPGNDLLIGAEGDDYLAGGLGHDVLWGGHDVAWGVGVGSDVFSFAEMGPGNTDHIMDFNKTFTDSYYVSNSLSSVWYAIKYGTDHIQLDSAAFPGLHYTTSGSTTYLQQTVYNNVAKTVINHINTGYGGTVTSTAHLNGVVNQQQFLWTAGEGRAASTISNHQFVTWHSSYGGLTMSYTSAPCTQPYLVYFDLSGKLCYDPDGGALNPGGTIATLSTSGGGHPSGYSLNWNIVGSGGGVAVVT